MKFKTKYKLLLWKSYFDVGYGITNYLKYPLMAFGLYSFSSGIDLRILFALTIFWGIFCFIFGYFWFKYGWQIAQAEVGNQYNLFMKEVRKKLIKNDILPYPKG